MENSKIKILLIEGNLPEANVIQEMLAAARQPECSVQHVQTLTAGLSLLRSHDFDCVLTDLGLPDSQGPEIALAVRKQSKRTPVIVLTDRDDEDVALTLLQMDIQDYLLKGEINCSLLIRSIRYAIERKRDVESLRFSEARYRALFRDIPTMIVTLDAELTMLSVNPVCASQLGYTIEELEGRSVLTLFHADDRPAVTEQLRSCLQNPHQVYRWQFRKIRKDGELLWVEEIAQTVYELNGARTLLLVCQDITEHRRMEEALRESENKFAKAFQAAPSSLIISSLTDGKYREVNEAFEKMLGYRRDELIGRSALELNIWQNPADRTMVLRMLAEGEKVRDLEIGFRSKAGSILVCRYSAEIIDVSGEQCLLSLVSDITARKEAEEALRKSEKKFLTIFHAVPAILGITTLAEGRFIDINETCMRILGYQREEVIGQTALELGIWDSPAERNKAIGTLQQQGTIRDIEINLRGKTGEIFVGLMSAEFIEIEGEQYILSMINDVTARKRAEESLRQRTSELEAIFTAFPDIYFWVDAEARIIDYKGPKADLYASPEVFLKKRMQEVLPPEVGEQMQTAVQQVFTTVAPAALEYWLPLRKGKQAFEARLLPLFGNQVFVIVRNITERKQMEEEIEQLNMSLAMRAAELEAANQELEAFNYTVAHDLRNPLNAISGYSQVIKELCSAKLDEDCQGYLREVYAGTLRMNRMIDALLNFSRLTHVAPQQETVDLSALAQEVAKELRLSEPARRRGRRHWRPEPVAGGSG